MNNRLLCNLLVLLSILTACTGNGQTAAPQVQADSTAMPTVSTTVPLETPLPAPTTAMTPTMTSTPIPAPENSILAESGFDLADVQVVNVQADTVKIEFKYRIADQYVLKPNQRLAVMLLIPSACQPKNSRNPLFDITDPVGTGVIVYNQTLKSRCSLPFFDLAIEVIGNYDATDVFLKEMYWERIQQPLEVAGNLALVDSRNLTVKNIEFHTTGSWSGQLTFDYAFHSDVPLAPGRYRFGIRAAAVVRACSLWTVGPILDRPEGKYILDTNLFSADDPDCLAAHDSFSYEGATIFLRDTLTDAEPYSHAIGFTFTLKKKP